MRDADGTTPDGIPYYDFTGAVPGGTLVPGGSTTGRTLSFFNPDQVRFTYGLVFFGLLNRAPEVVTVPVIEASVGRPYTYNVDARDPDGDQIRYALMAGPAGMAIDPATGVLAWSPTVADVGSHSVAIRASDERGGTTEQAFVI